jgi:dCTP deaminase
MLLPDWFWEAYGTRVVHSIEPLRINPTSVDLTLAPAILLQRYRGIEYDNVPMQVSTGSGILLDQRGNPLTEPFQPGDSVLASTNEYLKVPSWLRLQGMLKSSLAREGVNHRTALYVDPGFRGNLTLELEFARSGRLLPFMPIIQVEGMVVFPRKDYRARKGHYGGSDGVVTNQNRMIAFLAEPATRALLAPYDE